MNSGVLLRWTTTRSRRPQSEAQQVQGQAIDAALQRTVADALPATDHRLAVAEAFRAAIDDVAERLVAPVAPLTVAAGQLEPARA